MEMSNRRVSQGQAVHETNSLADCLFDAASSWRIISGNKFADGQLSITAASSGAIQVEWTAQSKVRPDRTAPTRIELLVPTSEVANQSAWDLKGDLLSNFISSGADTAPEPLSSAFLQSLTEKGYTVARISNASVSDAKLKLKLAPYTRLEKVDLNAALTLECDTLSLTDVNISNCHISFQVGGGTWSNVRMSGEKTSLTGHLGGTAMDEKCVFESGYLAADLRNGGVSVSNLKQRIKSMIFDSSLMPRELLPYLGTPLTPEQVAAMHARIASFKPQEVNASAWNDARDLGVGRSS
jgi:hypothetical protein